MDRCYFRSQNSITTFFDRKEKFKKLTQLSEFDSNTKDLLILKNQMSLKEPLWDAKLYEWLYG